MISFLPDINVWLALTWGRHPHAARAAQWFNDLEQTASVLFCRFTQIGLLRLLTTTQVMADDVMTTGEAWAMYDGWLQDERIDIANESERIESAFRHATVRFHQLRAPKTWGDAYLVAFAGSSGCRLVTFDRAMVEIAPDAVVLLSTKS